MKEDEIRPKEIFEEYLRLSLQDAQSFDQSSLVEIDCPACNSKSSLLHIQKNGFDYRRCGDCGSLFCSPRPSARQLDEFYENSKSSHYWATEFFPAVAEARREKLFRPKAEQVRRIMEESGHGIQSICDVGAGYGIFLDELKKVFPQAELAGVEPSPELSKQCQQRGIEVLTTTAEGAGAWENRFDLVISSEVIEHVYSASDFLQSLVQLAKPGGMVLMTGLGYEGFDILTLQEKSNSVFPPHHINFLSISGFEKLMAACQLRDIQIITPGKLDVDIVLKSDHKNEFLRVLAERGPETLAAFQDFLVKNRLSSHIWCMGIKSN